MNWRKLVLLGCVAVCVFAASMAKAQMRGHVNSTSQMRMHGALTPRSIARMPMHRAPMRSSMGRMPMRRTPMNSALGFRRFNRFNNGDFNRANRFHRFKHFNEIIFIGNFASRWWWGPWWNWNWVYPYGSYVYSYPSDYSGYGYGYGNYGNGYAASGYDYGYVSPPLNYYDYANDDEGAVRNVLAEYEVSWNGHDAAAFGRLFTEDSDYVNIAGVHWKGAQEIVQRHAELFQKRSKTAVRKLTGVEVRFSAPDVALVHATWDVTGGNRPTGEAVPVLKEISTMVVVKTNGKWLITSFQNTESGD
jgi:uncharacterized protein (TIGR02246 family)